MSTLPQGPGDRLERAARGISAEGGRVEAFEVDAIEEQATSEHIAQLVDRTVDRYRRQRHEFDARSRQGILLNILYFSYLHENYNHVTGAEMDQSDLAPNEF